MPPARSDRTTRHGHGRRLAAAVALVAAAAVAEATELTYSGRAENLHTFAVQVLEARSGQEIETQVLAMSTE